MGIKITLQSNIPVLIEAIGPALDAAVASGAKALHDQIDALMEQPKHGRLYIRRTKGGASARVASAPGEAPGIDTAEYINSVRDQMTGPAEAAVYTDDELGPMLEFGTTRMGARPHFAPAVEMQQAPFQDTVAMAVNDAELKAAI